jgi:hypothetical protein
MTKFITLNMIAGRESSHDESGEDDGLAAVTVSEGDRVGTRIMFRNGSALPVKETLAEVRALIQAVQP